MLRILITDDHKIMRDGLKKILGDSFPSVHFGEAANSSEAIKMVEKYEWDLIIMDINLPGRNGLDAIKEIQRSNPHIPILVLSMYPEDQFAVRAIRAGASGYLNKDSAPDELVTAIKTIRQGHPFITSTVALELASEVRGEMQNTAHKSLSDREYEVLCHIASGKPVSAIAQELSLSVKTISTYRSKILEKLGMKNNAELTYYAIRNGLIT